MARQQLEQLHQAPRHDLVLGRALGHVCPERLELPRELVHAANELRHSLGLVEDCVEQQRTLLLRVHVDRLGRQDGRPAQVHDGQAHRAQVTVYRGFRVSGRQPERQKGTYFIMTFFLSMFMSAMSCGSTGSAGVRLCLLRNVERSRKEGRGWSQAWSPPTMT